jgi:protein gp37
MPTGIGWTDETWNWLVGCRPKSEGCGECYAGKLASTRLRHLPLYDGVAENGVFTGVVRVDWDKLYEPLSVRQPKMWFINSMSDLFESLVPIDALAEAFAVMALSPHHRFQGLTKSHGVMRSRMTDPEFRADVDARARRLIKEDPRAARNAGVLQNGQVPWPAPNVWLGVSVENQHWADVRIPALLETPAAVRFLSCEPLLGPLDVTEWLHESVCPIRTEDVCTCDPAECEVRVDWGIVGGQSGGMQPMHPDWARSLRGQFVRAGVAFWFKQWGTWVPFEPDAQEPFLIGQNSELVDAHLLPEELSEQQPVKGWWWPGPDTENGGIDVIYRRLSKKAAGNQLDGVTWEQFPEGA